MAGPLSGHDAAGGGFCFLCGHVVGPHPDGTLSDHPPAAGRPAAGAGRLAAASCPGSGLSVGTTRTIAATSALGRPHP